MTRDLLTSGSVVVTVSLPPTFVAARAALGEEWHPTYTYRIDRVDNATNAGYMLFLSTLTTRPKCGPSYVYTGVLHPLKGSLRLTAKSAFPATATRVRVADRVFSALFAGRLDRIEATGWVVTAKVEKELAGRF